MADFQHFSIRYEHVEAAGSVAIATLLEPQLKDDAAAVELGDELVALLATKPAALIINYGRVKFMTSSFIGQLVRVWKQSNAQEVRLILTELSDLLAQLLSVARLDREIDTISPEHRAVASLAGPGE